MTPKEKAKDLMKQYVFFTATDLSDENFEEVRNCALIAVREILKECVEDKQSYWQEVKQEIKNF